jgi:hypothetical protein
MERGHLACGLRFGDLSYRLRNKYLTTGETPVLHTRHEQTSALLPHLVVHEESFFVGD